MSEGEARGQNRHSSLAEEERQIEANVMRAGSIDALAAFRPRMAVPEDENTVYKVVSERKKLYSLATRITDRGLSDLFFA
jgi:hypothetical protein